MAKLDRAPSAESGPLLTLAAGPRRQRSVVQRADSDTRRNPRRRRRARRLSKHAERRSRNCREGEHPRLAPEDLGGGDRYSRHDVDLSVDARLIRVDLQEQIADAQRHALRMRDDDFDFPHVVDDRTMSRAAQRILSTAGLSGIAVMIDDSPQTPERCRVTSRELCTPSRRPRERSRVLRRSPRAGQSRVRR